MQKELKQKTGRTNDDHQFKRTINFNLRLSPVEYESIVQQWKNSQLNVSLCSCLCLCEEDKIEIHLEQKQKEKLNRLKIFVEINRIGHNLNQLTKQINSQYAFKAKDLIEELAHIKAELEKL
jgi:hypothetical protein